MSEWSREEIESHITRLERLRVTVLTMDSIAVIRHLLQQLEEAEKRVAGECAEIAQNFQFGEDLACCGMGIADRIRHKYGIGG